MPLAVNNTLALSCANDDFLGIYHERNVWQSLITPRSKALGSGEREKALSYPVVEVSESC